MRFFGKGRPRIRGVVDVGSDAIKALLFEFRSDDAGAGQMNGGVHPARIRPIEKFVSTLPPGYTGLRLVQKIRENVFAMVRRIERVPAGIVIAIGPTVAEYKTDTWRVALGNGNKLLTRRELASHYQRLFEENSDLRRAAITAPVEVLVNGWPLAAGEKGLDEQILPRSEVKELAFRTLSLYMPVELGAVFAEIKNVLGGMPIEFVPLALAEKEAVVSALGAEDFFLIDVGGAETSLIAVKKGRFARAAFIPLGARGMRDVKSRDKEIGQWKELFRKALGAFYTSGPLPTNVLLAGGGARIAQLRSALQTADWLGEFSHAVVPGIRVLEGASFFGGDTLAGHLGGPEDAGLASLIIYSLGHRPLF